MHRYSFTAGRDGERLLQRVRAACPTMPESVVFRALKDRDVKVNGRRVSENVTLASGDSVEIFTLWRERGVPVVFEDHNLILFNKPYGISVDRDRPGAFSLLSYAEGRAAGAYRPRLCHRLDNQTTGLVLVAKNAEAEKAVGTAFRERLVEKRYHCVVVGRPAPERALLKAYLAKDPLRARVTVRDTWTEGAAEILTEYRLLEGGDASRLEVTLHTGKTHQIRAQLAHIGHPVLGDGKYGDFQANRRFQAARLLLCATGLCLRAGGFLSYLDGRAFSIEAPF